MRVENVRAYYEMRHGRPLRAVDGVSFDLADGEILGVVGESGCGKSTLASVLSGSGPPNLRIEQGLLAMDNAEAIDIAEAGGTPIDWRGDIISLLPQRALNSLNPTARIGDYAYDVIRAHKGNVSRREAIELTEGRLEQLGLPARVLRNYPHQLSGGMRQRVVTVISTLLNPTVLIADEPTSALDVSSQKSLILMLHRMMAEDMISRIIFITHDLALLSNIANRIAVMYAGEIVEMGTTEEVVRRPEHPYSKALIGSTLEPDVTLRGHEIQGLHGSSPDMRNPPPGCRFHPRCAYAMDICARQVPPRLGPEQNHATCWWVKKQVEEHAVEGEDRVSGEHVATAT
jgi:peptide/nickel transport system ATP-binding protein